MKIAFRDLSLDSSELKERYFSAINKLYEHGQFILGPEVKSLEDKLAESAGRKHCIAVSSGTFALYAVLFYLKNKFPKRTQVILPSISWIATAQAILAAGLEPYFVDTDEDFFINTKAFEKAITAKTLAVISVDFTGVVGSTYSNLISICSKKRIYLIQDSAQAYGSYYKEEDVLYRACGVGFASCLSINSMKLLASHGEGGAIFTDNSNLEKHLRLFRSQGCQKRDPKIFGLNGRMETLQAAIALVSMQEVDKLIEARQKIAAFYIKSLIDISEIKLPFLDTNKRHTFYTFQIRVRNRDELFNYLMSNNIECQKQYSYLLSDTPHLSIYPSSNMEISRRIVNTALCLPCHEKLKKKDINYITQKIKTFYS